MNRGLFKSDRDFVMTIILMAIIGWFILAVTGSGEGQTIIRIEPHKTSIIECAKSKQVHDRIEQNRKFIHQFCNRRYPVNEANALINIQKHFHLVMLAWDRYTLDRGELIAVEGRLDKLEELERAWAHGEHYD